MAKFEKDSDLNLEATELRLGLPGCDKDSPCSRANNKRALPIDTNEDINDPIKSSTNISSLDAKKTDQRQNPPSKAQVVGWPPVRSYRKNCLQASKKGDNETINGLYVKVSMDGAPYLRKMDLKLYKCYAELLKALEDMFKFKLAGEYNEREGYNGSEFVPTYEDKDGDWMLLGDVPWEMFMCSCKRLRIMKGSEARGLGCAV